MSLSAARETRREPFDAWLRRYMTEEGLTVGHIAVLLHVTPKTVYDWLRGHGPRHEMLLRKLLDSVRDLARQLKALLGED